MIVKTPLRLKDLSDDEYLADVPVLLPHQILQHLFNDIKLELPEAHVQEYWTHTRTFMEWARAHPSDGSHVPLGLYGDEARCGETNDSKLLGLWLNMPLFKPSSNRCSRWLMCALESRTSFGPRSLYPILQEIVKSINALFEGHDPQGNDLGIGRRFAVTELRGDWEYFYTTFRLTRYWKTNQICWRCNTEGKFGTALPYWKITDPPNWWNERLSYTQFLSRVLPQDGLQ